MNSARFQFAKLNRFICIQSRHTLHSTIWIRSDCGFLYGQHRTLTTLFTCFWPKRSGDCHLEDGGWRCHLEAGGWREGDLLFCLEGGGHTASKDKDEKEKERRERERERGVGGGGGGGQLK